MTNEMLMGIGFGAGVPILIWATRLHLMTKRILNMHLSPDDYGFGTGSTNKLISTLIEKQDVIHRENMGSTTALRHAVRELSHYVRWDTKERTGKQPPPYVRDKD